MSGRLREAVVPAYLFLCLLLGGSSQGAWSNLVLQLLALALIGWSLITPVEEPLSRPAGRLLVIAGAAVLIGFAHLVPLPPAIWSALPGRSFVADGFAILGQPLPWLPLSLAPYDTIATLLTLLPPIAVLAAMLRLKAYRPEWLLAALIAGTIAGVLLGVMQVSSEGPDSPWRLYRITNRGVATGFFANSNHMAALLVVSIPFLAALAAWSRRRSDDRQRYSAIIVLAAAALLVVVIGLMINASLAGVGLGLPVLLASGLLLTRKRGSRWRAVLLIAPALLIASVAAMYVITVRSDSGADDARLSVESRRTMAMTSIQTAAAMAPLGSGVGTFAKIYAIHESPEDLEATYVNHAHNDYLELAVETGVPGVIVLLLFLAWWAGTAQRCWRDMSADVFARAATIASAAILAHSIVDYPLRTAALAGLFAMCLALMAQTRPPPQRSSRPELWPSRHLELR